MAMEEPIVVGAQTFSHSNDIDIESRSILNTMEAMDKYKGFVVADSTAASKEQNEGSEDSPVQLTEEEETYPEGGLQAWLIVFGSFAGLMASLGIANTLGTFQAYISDNQLSAYNESAIGWIFSLYAFMAFFLGIYIGAAFDKYGPRGLILAGSICLIVSMFCLGKCTEYWHFLLDFGLLAGTGTALLFTPCFAVVGHYFREKRGTATGLAASGGAVGGIVFPLTLQKLFASAGFAWGCYTIGFMMIFLCIIANLLLRSRLSPAKNATTSPDFRIFKQKAFTVTVLGVFLMEWALFVPLAYITSYALQKGFSQAFSYQILPILNVGSVFGRLLPGYYADRIGRYNTAIIFIALTVIAVFAIWLPAGGTTAGLVIFSLLFGFASGSNISLTPVCIGQLCATQNYGRYYATCYTVVSLSCLTGLPLVGAIVAVDGGQYWGLILFVGFCYVGSVASFTAARGMAAGWSLKVKY